MSWTSALPTLVLLSSLLSTTDTANALQSNPPQSPQLLSDTTDVCTAAQGRTSYCEVELDVPAACIDGASSNCPIVFFFHGKNANNNWYAATSDVHIHKVIGVYPQGENDQWNIYPGGSNVCTWDDYACTSDPDEGAFVASIIAELRALGAHGNVYAVGMSNGAGLAHRLAANAGSGDLPIKGIVTKVMPLYATPSRSGPGELNYNQPSANGPAVSVLNIMGTDDSLIPYNGGPLVNDFQLMSALGSMETWAAHNGCDIVPSTSTKVFSTNADPTGTATFYDYSGCPDGVIVEHYALVGAGHLFGAGAALDGVSIDFDVAYEFIGRVEAASQTISPSSSPVASPVVCKDDPTWHRSSNADQTCDSVALYPNWRCGWTGADGTTASEACKVACDTCPVAPAPTPSPSNNPTKSPTKDPVTSNPTNDPSASPTESPTDAPTPKPTSNPTGAPSTSPIKRPTNAPSSSPTKSPTDTPTKNPTSSPTSSPITPSPTPLPLTPSPTAMPTLSPTPCIPCTNVPTPWMIRNGYECATAPNSSWFTNRCNLDQKWVNNLYCEGRCQDEGLGYGTGCCSSTIFS
mmetsp:Transcript_8154/g.17621  ORF Transcript_8154/g.17621 Transcript_8154/m.17621 type:complete len:576 (-) Transcript_8154:404-2131(-)|eukprot:CAMPEP_0183737876 /NCGR_PEP_ID=MMETSP0737-20130205/53241_1 /TAXON_ID=385413 /ORGANISM="Thalassiosira miniscula, Strain CCMP1093" /LENGTH=575 /DNA_ID=CAMNT_0025972277 /DNA_START=28 /DNA_END=1755 /DNA_ORIENTATION=-